jgi:hypothetical protein
MDRLAKITKEELIRRMRSEFEKTMTEVTAAVNDAPDGHLIDASEERCRDVLGEFRRIAYETAVQMRVEATEADPSFSPSGPGSDASRSGEADGAELLRSGAGSPAALRKPRRGDRRTGG